MSGGGGADAVVVPAEELLALAAGLLASLGVAPDDARVTADVFVGAELSGEPSHGLRLLLTVCDRIEAGGHRARTEIVVEREVGAIAVWSANRSIGQVVATRAMAAAIGKAKVDGIGLVAVRDATSLTSAKHYALAAARAGAVGLVLTNASRKVMPPPGGTTPVMGNNPLAIAAPAGRYGAFALDMAMTAAAIERINVAAERGEPIPPDWALGPDGRPTTDPLAAQRIMTLLPFGGYKAFGLGLAVEMLTSVLAGGEVFCGASAGFRPAQAPMNTSFALVAIDLEVFGGRAAFEARMEEMIERMKASAPAEPGGEILFPGERSQRLTAERLAGGVPVARATLEAVRARARTLGAAVD